MWLWLPPVLLIVVAAGVLLILWLRSRGVPVERARQLFRQQREHLEAQFFQAAANSGKPRGLRWKACEWDDAVEFARDRRSRLLVALASVTISFEAIEGGDMEGLPAVGNLRNASAVFSFDGKRWSTAGRAVFNLNPDEAIRHFGKQYERLETVEPPAPRAGGRSG
jgi:hypothetical protein